MRFDILKRLRRLEAAAAQAQAGKTVFTLGDGTQFLTELDPLTYLLQHGPQTTRGRIVGCERAAGRDADPISRSVGEYIRDLLEGGGEGCV